VGDEVCRGRLAQEDLLHAAVGAVVCRHGFDAANERPIWG
jgi:hypothetical protein